jgi:hypothetical protein
MMSGFFFWLAMDWRMSSSRSSSDWTLQGQKCEPHLTQATDPGGKAALADDMLMLWSHAREAADVARSHQQQTGSPK